MKFNSLFSRILVSAFTAWSLFALDCEADSSRPVVSPPTAAAANALTLQHAIELALANNPQIRSADGCVAAAKARAAQARLWTNPELELRAEDWPVAQDGGYSQAKQLVGVAQTFPFPGKKKLDAQIGRGDVRVAEGEAELRRVELVREVKIAFYRALAARQSAQAAAELRAVAESSAATTRKRVEAGAIPAQEQLRAEIQMQQAEAEWVGLQRDLTIARQNLAALMGRPELLESPLDGSLSETPDPKLVETVGAESAVLTYPESLLRFPSVVAAKANLERVESAEKRARLEPYPDVKAGLAGGWEGSIDSSIIQVGISVPLPIIDRGKARKQEARANSTVAEAELSLAEQRLARRWGEASQQFQTALRLVATYRESILPKANEALRLVQKGFEQGKFGFIDLADTQRTAAEARLAYQQKLLDLNVAQAELEALLTR